MDDIEKLISQKQQAIKTETLRIQKLEEDRLQKKEAWERYLKETKEKEEKYRSENETILNSIIKGNDFIERTQQEINHLKQKLENGN